MTFHDPIAEAPPVPPQIRRSSKYLNRFIRLKCAPALISYGLFPNVKEITESMACVEALEHLDQTVFDRSSYKPIVLCVGDGVSPRTGALFAHMSRWSVVSIDPLMREKGYYSRISRLRTLQSKAEDVAIYTGHRPVLIVQTHSHAKLPAACGIVVPHVYSKAPVAAITMPCCTKQELPTQEPALTYRDEHVHSPANEIKIWHNVVLGALPVATNSVEYAFDFANPPEADHHSFKQPDEVLNPTPEMEDKWS